MAQQQKASDSLKVLSIVWYKVLPAKYGGQKAVACFNKTLAAYCALTCLCSGNNTAENTTYKVKAELPLRKSQFLNPFTWKKIYAVAKAEKATHLLLEFPYHGLAGLICKRWLGLKLVVNTHNIEFLRFKEQGKWWWKMLYFFEKKILQKADLVFFKTDDDLLAARQHFKLKNSTAVIPYGVERTNTTTKEVARKRLENQYKILPGETILLFAATLDYEPNAKAVTAIFQELVPRLNATNFSYKIFICGRNKLPQFAYLQQHKHSSVIMTGEVENIEAFFEGADVFIDPVVGGGGIQTKIIDALSFNLNVVCFQNKASVIENTGNKLFTVELQNWDQFAANIIKACANNEPTPEGFFKNYAWDNITRQAYDHLINL